MDLRLWKDLPEEQDEYEDEEMEENIRDDHRRSIPVA